MDPAVVLYLDLDYVVCSGTEYDLVDCQTGNETRQSSHSEDVGVKCQTSKERLCTCMACQYTVYVILERMPHTNIIVGCPVSTQTIYALEKRVKVPLHNKYPTWI